MVIPTIDEAVGRSAQKFQRNSGYFSFALESKAINVSNRLIFQRFE